MKDQDLVAVAVMVSVWVVKMVPETVTVVGTVSDSVTVVEMDTEPEMVSVMVTVGVGVGVMVLVADTEMVPEMVPVTEKEMEIVKFWSYYDEYTN